MASSETRAVISGFMPVGEEAADIKSVIGGVMVYPDADEARADSGQESRRVEVTIIVRDL